MPLSRLRADNYRKLRRVDIELSPRITLVEGDNAAGKSSLLEAIKTLSAGTRESQGSPLRLGEGGDSWQVVGWRRPDEGELPARRLCVRGNRRGMHRTIDGRPVNVVQAARELPVLSLDQGGDRPIVDAPTSRRRYLDWLLFHVEPEFVDHWRRYRKALAQRNAQLAHRGGGADATAMAAIESLLASSGEAIRTLRRKYFDDLCESLAGMLAEVVGGGSWSVELSDGWEPDLPLAETLRARRDADRRAGRTQVGPHRADLRFRRGGRGARQRLSGGEVKLATAALLLHQAMRLKDLRDVWPLVLIDDFSAELGAAAAGRLVRALAEYGGQMVITELSGGHPGLLALRPRWFHVEHGALRPVVE